MKVYDGIMQGLNEAVAYNEGKIKAGTKTLLIDKKQSSRHADACHPPLHKEGLAEPESLCDVILK